VLDITNATNRIDLMIGKYLLWGTGSAKFVGQ